MGRLGVVKLVGVGSVGGDATGRARVFPNYLKRKGVFLLEDTGLVGDFSVDFC